MLIGFALNFINWENFFKKYYKFWFVFFSFNKKLEEGVKEIIKFYHKIFLYKNSEGESKKKLKNFDQFYF